MKVLSIVGNRPQFIKSAPMSLALRDAGIDEVVLHTGQHYDREMSDVFFEELALPQPRYRLDLHTAEVDAMEPGIRGALERERPDWALVYGDTNSTVAGARASVTASIRLGHVEAGLRSGDLSMPEERNRIEVDGHADVLFAPDERSREILLGEDVPGRVEVVGDVMRDALDLFAPIARQRSHALERFGVEPASYVLCTIHRQANVTPDKLRSIANALNRLPERVVFPAHPRTRPLLRDVAAHVAVAPPQSYLDLVALTAQARVVLTDSGGLQKEAYWQGVPCVTVRPSTEWVDTVEVGANVLVDVEEDAIVAAVATAQMPRERPSLYGDGAAARRIAASLYASPPE